MSVALALLSSLLWGGSDFAGGTLSRRRDAVRVVLGSQAIGLLTALILATGAAALTDPSDYVGWSVVAGISGVTGLLCFYTALARGTMGVVSPIASLSVIVPLVLGLLSGERPGALALVGVAVAVVGVVLASGPELRGAAGVLPVALAGVSAVGFGLALYAIAQGAKSSPLMTLVGMRMTSVLLLSVGLVAVAARQRHTRGEAHSNGQPYPQPAPQPDPQPERRRWSRADYLWLLAAGVGDVTANWTFGLASTGAYVSIISVLGSLYPVVTVLLAVGVHGERLVRIQLGGVVLALAGVALIASG
ncbi:MAG: EamA family transporter [Actinomycetales bacterium]